MNQIITIILILFASTKLFSQEGDWISITPDTIKGVVSDNDTICTCSHYFLKSYTEVEKYFSTDSIKKNKIKEIVVYTTPYSRWDTLESKTSFKVRKPIAKEYVSIKIIFDAEGRVKMIKEFYNSTPSTIVSYERDPRGNIIKQTGNYMDSTENVSNDGLPETIIDNTYNDKNQLIKSKHRSYDGKILADNLSQWETYQYDFKNRIVTQHRHYYWDINYVDGRKQTEEENDIKTTYFDDKSTSCLEFYSSKKLIYKELTQYNKNGLAIQTKAIQSYNLDTLVNTYRYNKNNQIVVHQVKSQQNQDLGGECPEGKGGEMDERYYYNSNGLLEKKVSSYDKYSCVLQMEFKK